MKRPSKLWQRNVIGAVVTVASLAAVVATDLGPKWSHYLGTVHPGADAPRGEDVTVDSQSWKLGEVRHLGRRVKPPGSTLPAGTVVTVVTVLRDGAPGPELGCDGVLTDGRHRWRGQPPIHYGLKPVAGAALNCARPGPIQWAFTIPDGVVPTALDVTTYDGSILVRLQL
ncbi:hypothetical protein [Mycobacterium sp. SMC-4]|uniref:hypothetical protein n=1 Tax=Mycobacterium sp. SMC-4 TaxID=2857059 RepID=UPI003CFF4A92